MDRDLSLGLTSSFLVPMSLDCLLVEGGAPSNALAMEGGVSGRTLDDTLFARVFMRPRLLGELKEDKLSERPTIELRFILELLSTTFLLVAVSARSSVLDLDSDGIIMHSSLRDCLGRPRSRALAVMKSTGRIQAIDTANCFSLSSFLFQGIMKRRDGRVVRGKL